MEGINEIEKKLDKIFRKMMESKSRIIENLEEQLKLAEQRKIEVDLFFFDFRVFLKDKNNMQGG